MPFILQPATKENALQRIEVQIASYADDPVVPSLMPGVSHEEKVEFFSQVSTLETKVGDKPWIKDLEIVDTDTGRVAACARWKYPTSEKEEPPNLADVKSPPGTNEELSKAFFAVFAELVEKYLDTTTMYFLASMNVHPDYQRRGLGKLLMEEALEDADRNGKKTFLLASDAGKKLYAKFGFESLEEKVFDLRDLGAVGLRRTTAQMREPKGKAGNKDA